jgi:hypothetical protein
MNDGLKLKTKKNLTQQKITTIKSPIINNSPILIKEDSAIPKCKRDEPDQQKPPSSMRQ